MATGMAIMGFGGGAMIGAPLKQWLLSLYQIAPDYLGAESTLQLITENGRRFVQTASGKIEVVIATAQQAEDFGGDSGAYIVGTGNTGASATFMTLGIIYFVVMICAAF
jgi:hypothetical protein